MDLVKGSTDLATPSVTQREVAMYMKNYDFEGHVQDNCKLYGHRRDVMCNAIKEYFPKDVKCTYPHGGLFLWVELPEGCNSQNEVLGFCQQGYHPGQEDAVASLR